MQKWIAGHNNVVREIFGKAACIFIRVSAQIDKTTPTRNIANTLRVILNVDLENSLFKD